MIYVDTILMSGLSIRQMGWPDAYNKSARWENIADIAFVDPLQTAGAVAPVGVEPGSVDHACGFESQPSQQSKYEERGQVDGRCCNRSIVSSVCYDVAISKQDEETYLRDPIVGLE